MDRSPLLAFGRFPLLLGLIALALGVAGCPPLIDAAGEHGPNLHAGLE